MVVYSGSNTDYKSSEPLKTLVMLYVASILDYNLLRGIHCRAICCCFISAFFQGNKVQERIWGIERIITFVLHIHVKSI